MRDITAGAIRQSAITLYPGTSGATMNRQVIVPTQAVINHAADMGLCDGLQVLDHATPAPFAQEGC